MLVINNLNVSYRNQKILEEISFSLTPHRLTVILGKNGSGKSTLVSCINQTTRYLGEISYSDRNLALISPKERAHTISILPQILTSPHITVEELVTLGRNPYVSIGKQLSNSDIDIIEDAIKTTKICDLRYKMVDEISGGERQKAYMAMILAQNTNIIVLDEPTTYMDMEYETSFFELLTFLKKVRKKTLFVVMHNLNEAIRYADNIIILDNGKIRFSGTKEECLDNEVIEKLFYVNKYVIDNNNETIIIFRS